MRTERWPFADSCSACGKPVGKGRAKGLCASCYHKQHKIAFYAVPANAANYRATAAAYHQKHKATVNAKITARNRQLKMDVIAGLGGRCLCCGETEPIFLTLDHIKGGGRKEYQRLGGTLPIYRQVKREGFPPEKYRLLCWNCNAALGLFGHCPHSSLTAPVFRHHTSASSSLRAAESVTSAIS